jgi:hypothetical protein
MPVVTQVRPLSGNQVRGDYIFQKRPRIGDCEWLFPGAICFHAARTGNRWFMRTRRSGNVQEGRSGCCRRGERYAVPPVFIRNVPRRAKRHASPPVLAPVQHEQAGCILFASNRCRSLPPQDGARSQYWRKRRSVRLEAIYNRGYKIKKPPESKAPTAANFLLFSRVPPASSPLR